jgi:dephospho-CoA kinase
MRRIGLTGGIATGKSYVVARMREAGVRVIDADVLAREAVAPGSEGLAAVVKRFGGDILTPEGSLDRARLGDIVFQDLAARRDLETIVHPFVRTRIGAFFRELPEGVPFAVADIPLLYETGAQGQFDKVIVVACARETQVQRIMARDGLPRVEAERRLAAQLPIAAKIARADRVITTDGSKAETDAQVTNLVSEFNRL